MPTHRAQPQAAAGDLPFRVLGWMMGLFGLMLIFYYLAFGRSAYTSLQLGICLAYCVVYFGTPLALIRSEIAQGRALPRSMEHFRRHGLETWTGHLEAHEAVMQILLIPASLTLAAGLIAAINVIVR